MFQKKKKKNINKINENVKLSIPSDPHFEFAVKSSLS